MSLLHRNAQAEQLALARIAVFGLWFVVVLPNRSHLYDGLPIELVQPTGLMRLVPVDLLVSSASGPLVVKLAALAGAALCVLGVRPFTPIALATVAALTVHDGLMKSIGAYANHAQVALLLAALVIALFPAADAYAMGRRGRREEDRTTPDWRYAAPLVATASLITLAYAFIGTRRLAQGGPDIYVDGSMTTWSVVRSLSDIHVDAAFGMPLLEHRWLVGVVGIGFLATTLAEIASPLALRFERFRLVWLALIIPFHVSTLVMMKIFFWENLVLLVVLFTPLLYVVPRWIDRRLPGSAPSRGRPRPPRPAATTAPSGSPGARSSPR